ncbi:MAG: DUF6512 family protein [Promethearchaeota archaeon]|jgi:hypothetical protein
MDIDSKNYIFVRSGIYLVIFVLSHYLFKWFPNEVLSLFSSIDESVFQHMKLAFYSYLILSLIEGAIFRNKIPNKEKFIYSHILSAVIIPFIIFTLFLIGAMFYGERPFLVEIFYAITITFTSSLVTTVIEQEYKELEFNKRFKILLIVITVILIMEFTIFTFNLPWHDIFVDPYG